MKTRLCRLEFGIATMADLRYLYKAWDRFWATEDQENSESIMIYVTIEDRVPGEEVCLNFTATPETLDRFLVTLEQDGLKFTRNDFIAGLLIMCRVVHDRAGLTVIGTNNDHDPGRQAGRLSGSGSKNRRECGMEVIPHSHVLGRHQAIQLNSGGACSGLSIISLTAPTGVQTGASPLQFFTRAKSVV